MAVDNLRSMDGRYFGRDDAGYHRAFTGLKAPELKIGAAGSEFSVLGANAVQNASATSTATQLNSAGYVRITSTLAKDYSMAAPVPGVDLKIFKTEATTLAQTITFAAGTIQTTVGSSCNKINFEIAGSFIHLIGLTTALFGLISKSSTATISTA